MIRAIIIEDEINTREALAKLLKIVKPTIEIVAETGFVVEAIQLINQHKPDLVFMDIELEDGTGFDILKQLKAYSFKVIFTTAYNQYAIKAFKFSAIDYLLKPIDPSELINAVNKSIDSIQIDAEYQELLNILKDNLDKKEKKIVLKTTEQRYVIALNDIIRLEADGAYTLFITTNQKIIVSKNLKFYQELLDPSIFIRSHQSHLINKNHIKSLDKNDVLVMSNNDLVTISTRKKSEIKRLIADF